MRTLFRKQVAAHRRLWVRVPRLPLTHAITVPWSSGNDSWLTSRKRRFDSVRDYFFLSGRCHAQRKTIPPQPETRHQARRQSKAEAVPEEHRRFARRPEPRPQSHRRDERATARKVANVGSQPQANAIMKTNVLAEQPGVLATLSRWRSSVRIRSGTLRRGTQTGKAARLKPWRFVGSTPTRATLVSASVGHRHASVAVNHPL
jgi:hypothetical protein